MSFWHQNGGLIWFNGTVMGYKYISGWWLSPTPLKNDGLRQLGWWHSQYNGKVIKFHGSKPPVKNHEEWNSLKRCKTWECTECTGKIESWHDQHRDLTADLGWSQQMALYWPPAMSNRDPEMLRLSSHLCQTNRDKSWQITFFRRFPTDSLSDKYTDILATSFGILLDKQTHVI